VEETIDYAEWRASLEPAHQCLLSASHMRMAWTGFVAKSGLPPQVIQRVLGQLVRDGLLKKTTRPAWAGWKERYGKPHQQTVTVYTRTARGKQKSRELEAEWLRLGLVKEL